MRKLLLSVMLLVLFVSMAFASEGESLINREGAPVRFFTEYESGLFAVTGHTIKIGSSGTPFDYVTQGGQDILFPFERFTLGASIAERHRVSLLYQPLEINTIIPFVGSVVVDGKDIEGPVELKYGFPFWRVTYSYDLLDAEELTLGVGAALQIRNASIIFEEVDGEDVSVSQNVGPVPALHVYARWEDPSGLSLVADVTGLYASSAIINGASFEFEGSILDASLRAGYQLKNELELFANFRFLGGTSKGTSSYPGDNWSVSSGDDRFSQNNLGTFSATVGVTVR